MADDPKDPDDPKPDPKDELGDAGKKALESERKARREAEKQLQEIQSQLKELRDRDKSESEKFADRVAAAEKRASDAEAALTRLEVALDKGLTKTQARRLVGSTVEELEADAEDLLSSFKGDAEKPPAPNKPTETLRGGGDPTSEPSVDIRKVVEAIPRDL